jgi:small subunit ribosomal protein S11
MAEEADKQPARQEAAVNEKSAGAPPAAGAAAGGAAEGAPQGADGKPVRRERKSRLAAVPAGIAHVRATFNNTSISITDPRGGVIAWNSSGRAGFKGSRRSTAFAATVVAQDCARQAIARGMHEVEVRIQGAGAGRESAVRALQSSGLNVTVIKDVTSIPHNGCRPRKRRRV